MTAILEQTAKLVAILGSFSLSLGILFNFFFFLAVGPSWLSVLTISDHLSIAASVLPLVFILFAIMIWYISRAAENPQALGPKIFVPIFGPSKGTDWRPTIMFGLGLLPAAFGFPSSSIMFYLWGATILWNSHCDRIYERLSPNMTFNAKMLANTCVGASMILCSLGLATGLSRVEREEATVEVQIDNAPKFEAVLVGTYERGTLLIVKPGNQRLFVSQKSTIVIQEINRPHGEPPLYRKILRWIGR